MCTCKDYSGITRTKDPRGRNEGVSVEVGEEDDDMKGLELGGKNSC